MGKRPITVRVARWSAEHPWRSIALWVAFVAVCFLGGNAAGELVCAVLMRDGRPMRYFPIGAKSDVHVSLRVVEDLHAGSTVEVWLAAPAGTTGTVIVDLGLVEV